MKFRLENKKGDIDMVDIIYQMGADAMSNQATVKITPLPFMKNTEALQLRISSFKIPGYKISKYDVQYKGYTIKRAKKGNEEDRTLTIPFRVDRHWELYNMLRDWGKLVYDHDEGDAGLGDVPELRTSVQVSIDGGPTFVYEGCIYDELPEVEFDQTSDGEPIVVSFVMTYLKCIETRRDSKSTEDN